MKEVVIVIPDEVYDVINQHTLPRQASQMRRESLQATGEAIVVGEDEDTEHVERSLEFALNQQVPTGLRNRLLSERVESDETEMDTEIPEHLRGSEDVIRPRQDLMGDGPKVPGPLRSDGD